jgi:hypothetical protein
VSDQNPPPGPGDPNLPPPPPGGYTPPPPPPGGYTPPPPPPGYGAPQGGYGAPQGGYGAPPPGYGPPMPGGVPPNNQKALWAMILGIVALVCCGVFAGIPALILGNQAKREIAASGGMQGGEGMAKAGVILGWVSIGLSIVGVLFYAVVVVAANGS